MGQKIGLLVADKPDSQDICFVPDGDYASFIKGYSGREIPEGNFITPEGKILEGIQGSSIIRWDSEKAWVWRWGIRRSCWRSGRRPMKWSSGLMKNP